MRHRRFPLYFIAAIEVWNLLSFYIYPFSWLRLWNILFIPIGVSLGLYHLLGHPRNWWRMYFGTYVSIGGSSQVTDFETDEEVDTAILQWIAQSNIGLYHRHGSYYYQFFHKRDAVQFKLAWG